MPRPAMIFSVFIGAPLAAAVLQSVPIIEPRLELWTNAGSLGVMAVAGGWLVRYLLKRQEVLAKEYNALVAKIEERHHGEMVALTEKYETVAIRCAKASEASTGVMQRLCGVLGRLEAQRPSRSSVHDSQHT